MGAGPARGRCAGAGEGRSDALSRIPAETARESWRSYRAIVWRMHDAGLWSNTQGVLYLDGGWETLVKGLAETRRSLGVRFETDAAVEYVEHGSVRLANGRTISAEGVILAAGWERVKLLTNLQLLRPVRARMALLDSRASSFAR